MKRAFTLIELLVYMALLGFVIVVAGRVFSDSTIMRVRSQSMVKTSEEVGKVSSLLREDISQMGVKAWGQSNSSAITSSSSGYTPYYVYNVGENNANIYWDKNNGDVSSYALTHNELADGTFRDKIVFRKAAFDGEGRFIGIREITWEAKEDTRKLLRSCITLPNPVCPTGATCAPAGSDIDASVCQTKSSASASDAVVMAENVTNFYIIPSKPGMAGNSQDTLFGKATEPNFYLLSNDNNGAIDISSNIINNGTETNVSDFAQNASASSGNSRNVLYLAKDESGCYDKYVFKKDETYVIEFQMPFSVNINDEAELQKALNSTQFVPGRDHLSIGFRNVTGQTIDGAPKDILFYPAQSADANALKRRMEFSMSKDITNACVAITIAYYPPESAAGKFNGAEGKLNFSNFKVFRKADETFHFPKESADADYGTEAVTNATEKIKQKTNAKAFELFLEIENKGEKSGTISVDKDGNRKGMVITTPNNGVTPQN